MWFSESGGIKRLVGIQYASNKSYVEYSELLYCYCLVLTCLVACSVEVLIKIVVASRSVASSRA